jgi:hypothetical protein
MTTQPWASSHTTPAYTPPTTGAHTGRIYGTPGGGLVKADWLAASAKGAAKIGRNGEIATATLLNKYAAMDGGVSVMHDLKVPSAKYKANIDHIVVSGRTVHVIDAKVWKPAFYWTLGEKTRRGFERFEPAEKQTMVVITNALRAYFDQYGIKVDLPTPLLFVWPSSKNGSLSTRFLSVPGAEVIPGPKVEDVAERLFTPGRSIMGRGLFSGGKGRPADPQVIAALAPLVSGLATQAKSGVHAYSDQTDPWLDINEPPAAAPTW